MFFQATLWSDKQDSLKLETTVSFHRKVPWERNIDGENMYRWIHVKSRSILQAVQPLHRIFVVKGSEFFFQKFRGVEADSFTSENSHKVKFLAFVGRLQWSYHSTPQKGKRVVALYELVHFKRRAIPPTQIYFLSLYRACYMWQQQQDFRVRKTLKGNTYREFFTELFTCSSCHCYRG